MRGDQYLYGDEKADTVDVSEYNGCMCGFCVLQFIVEKGGLVPVELDYEAAAAALAATPVIPHPKDRTPRSMFLRISTEVVDAAVGEETHPMAVTDAQLKRDAGIGEETP